MSLFGKVGKLVTQSASHRINTEAIRSLSYLPNSKSFIGGIPSQSDEPALNPKALPRHQVRIDDALYRRAFEGLSGARRYSAAAAAGVGVSGTVALASVAGAGALNLAVFWHINDGIREILADYVHHEMTRTVMLVNLRLFLIIAAKDVFVSFAF